MNTEIRAACVTILHPGGIDFHVLKSRPAAAKWLPWPHGPAAPRISKTERLQASFAVRIAK